MTAVIEVPAPRRSAPLRSGQVRFVVGLLGTATLLAVVLPAIAGIDWLSLWRVVEGVPVGVLAGLVTLWAAGLALHTITLTAALPGLSARRAATLSLTGSAVANTLPAGGAAGIAVNVRMGMAWGFDASSMSRYTIVTNVCDVLTKVALPLVVVPFLVGSGYGARAVALVAPLAAVGAGALGTACALVVTRRGAALLGRGLDRLVGTRWGRRILAGPGPGTWEQRVTLLQGSVVALLRSRWPRLSLGMVLYTASLLALLLGCLAATGAVVPLQVGLSAFVVERLLTLAGITPGGAGLVEVALTALLVASGAEPVAAAAGVVLYRLLTVGLEIPVGGTWLLLWLSARTWRRSQGASCVSST